MASFDSPNNNQLGEHDARVRLVDATATVLIACAFVIAIRTTSDLTWPPRWDFFRELGSIQAILDGQGRADPLFRGEVRWYNPLVPTVAATMSRWFEVPLPTFLVRAGPYLNLFVPVGFYLLFRRLLSPWPAVLGLAVFLYWPAPYLSIGSAGLYSPWAWPRNIAQGFYFFGALTLALAYERGGWWRLVAGIVMGVCFLTHTAPALMLAVAAVLIVAVQAMTSSDSRATRRLLVTLAVVGVVALVTSAPYLLPLWRAYHLEVLNRAPMNAIGLSVPRMLVGLLSVRSACALFGVSLILRKHWRQAGHVSQDILVLASLLMACLLWLGLGVCYQILQALGVNLMQVVPEYHFHLYFKSFEAAFAGLAVASLVERLWSRLRRPAGLPNRKVFITQRPPWCAFVGACAIIVGLNWRAYLGSPDLKLFREESLARAQQTHLNSFYTWALARTRSDDVFLADNTTGFFAVSPSGRKVVSIFDVYANPYVALGPREQQRKAMYDALNAKDIARFIDLARHAGVTYVIAAAQAEPCCEVRVALEEPSFTLAFDEGPLKVYRVNDARPWRAPARVNDDQ